MTTMVWCIPKAGTQSVQELHIENSPQSSVVGCCLLALLFLLLLLFCYCYPYCYFCFVLVVLLLLFCYRYVYCFFLWLLSLLLCYCYCYCQQTNKQQTINNNFCYYCCYCYCCCYCCYWLLLTKTRCLFLFFLLVSHNVTVRAPQFTACCTDLL